MDIAQVFKDIPKLVQMATPEKLDVLQASMINLKYNLGRWPVLVKDISELYHQMTDEAQAEVMLVISQVMDDSDYSHLCAIFADYKP